MKQAALQWVCLFQEALNKSPIGRQRYPAGLGACGESGLSSPFAASPDSGMPLWEDRLYISMTKTASDATSFYRLPSNRVLELGQQFVI